MRKKANECFSQVVSASKNKATFLVKHYITLHRGIIRAHTKNPIQQLPVISNESQKKNQFLPIPIIKPIKTALNRKIT